MDLFSRTTTTPPGDHLVISFGPASSAAVPVSHGIYLAVIIGLMILLAIGSILAVQLRPYASPSHKLLGGDTNQPRLVDAADAPGHTVIVGEGGECHGQIA